MTKKMALFFLILSSFMFGVEESKIKSTMTEKTEFITSVLNKSLPKNQKEAKIVQSVEELFSYDIMAKISLGKTWQTLSAKDKSTFVKLFSKKLQQSYFDKLELYTDQKITIKDPEKVKSNRITLKSDIIGKDKTYEVVYKFYLAGKDHWKIYDVNIAGVSIIQSYRTQFSDFLKTKSFDELLRSL